MNITRIIVEQTDPTRIFEDGFFHGDLGVVALITNPEPAYRALAVIRHFQVRYGCVINGSNNSCAARFSGLAGLHWL